MPRLAGKAALVTGGTSGLGAETVRRFAAEGAAVAFAGRDAGRGAAVERETGAGFLAADVRSDADTARTVAAAVERLGGLDVLVCNAGTGLVLPLAETAPDELNRILDVNVTGCLRYARACFPHLEERRGSMIHIASDAGIRAVHEIAAYSVTKAGVIAVSELFGAEGAPYGIRSNAVCPGDIVPGVQATPAGHEEHAEDPVGWVLPPSGRFGTGEDVAGLVTWLVSDESAHMTGATLRIDGGTGAAMRVLTRR